MFFDISMEQRKQNFCWFWFVLLLCFYENQQKNWSYAKTSCPSKKQLYRSKLFLWLSTKEFANNTNLMYRVASNFTDITKCSHFFIYIKDFHLKVTKSNAPIVDLVTFAGRLQQLTEKQIEFPLDCFDWVCKQKWLSPLKAHWA